MMHTPIDGPSNPSGNQFEFEDIFSLKEIFAIIQRHKQLIALCVVIGLVFGFIYIFFAQPRYTASTSILIDMRQQNMLPDIISQNHSFKDRMVIDSQIELIRSSKMLEKAANRLGLFDNIQPIERSFWGKLKDRLSGNKKNMEAMDAQNKALVKRVRLLGFASGLKVERVLNTYVIRISYTSVDPKKAAEIANLVADVYLEDELEAQYEASQRTNEWLKTRLKILRDDLTKAERAVELYKEQNNLFQTDGKSLSEQQLSELSNQLADARNEAADAKAKFERIQQIIDAGGPDISMTNLINTRVISSLHDKYIELARSATEIRRQQGEEHQAYLNLKRQMGDIQQIIAEEYSRLAESYKAEFNLAQTRLDSLQKELDSVIDDSAISRRNEIELRELERRAESTRNLYTRMLDNFNEQNERQSVPIVNARIISAADIPLAPSWPNKQYIILISLALGAVAGGVVAFLREQFNRFIWKAEELEAVIHRTCLGMLPKIAFDGAKLGRTIRSEKRFDSTGFNVDGFAEVTQLLNKQTGVTTEIMRNIQLAIQFRKSEDPSKRRAKVISFVSARPGEGKSITSCFLAKHLAKTDAKVLLIDCDFRRPSLTHWYMPNAQKGFYEVASKLGENVDEEALNREIDELCFSTGDDPLYFMPAKGAATSITNLNLVASGQMHRLIQHLQTRFDAILIDLPPIINIVDARVVAGSIDNFIFLAHWGKTDRDLVKKSLLRAPEVYNKAAGALLTLVDTEKAGSYGYYNYNYYYHR